MTDVNLASKYIHELKLSPHPEGGWFTLVHASDDKIISPYKNGDRDAERPLCSVIHYLLAPEKLSLPAEDQPKKLPPRHRNHAGYFHTNNSTTVHTWHSGKAVYTLVKIPDVDTRQQNGHIRHKAELKRVIMGDDIQAGEQMVLIVPPGWWKRSETLSPDSHCLISETVTPAWTPEDHTFMAPSDLNSLFQDDDKLLNEFMPHVLPQGHRLDFT